MHINSLIMITAMACTIIVDLAHAHSFLLEPVPRSGINNSCRRNQPWYLVHGVMTNCPGPCDRPRTGRETFIQVERGQRVRLRWPRNNHPGGFTRVAWAPYLESDEEAIFHDNIQKISCAETGRVAGGACAPASGTWGGDDNGQEPDESLSCQDTITIPAHLPDGRHTMQWSWFSAADYLGDYFNCVDFEVTGGEDVTTQEAPVFNGGDFANPNSDLCRATTGTFVGHCRYEPCSPDAGPYGFHLPANVRNTVPRIISEPGFRNGNGRAPSTNGSISTIIESAPRDDYRCGRQFDNAPCQVGQCCSQYGYCGTSDAHCKTTQMMVPAANARPNTRCGREFGDIGCPAGQCCSQYGYCGATYKHCSNPQVTMQT